MNEIKEHMTVVDKDGGPTSEPLTVSRATVSNRPRAPMVNITISTSNRWLQLMVIQ